MGVCIGASITLVHQGALRTQKFNLSRIYRLNGVWSGVTFWLRVVLARNNSPTSTRVALSTAECPYMTQGESLAALNHIGVHS